MKSLISLLLCSLPLWLAAQDWLPVRPGNTYHYMQPGDSLVMSLWVDSTTLENGQPLWHLNRRVIRVTPPGSLSDTFLTNQPHFLMRRYQVMGGQYFRFYDTTDFRLYPGLTVGATRLFSPATALQATLTRRTDSVIFGVADSVQHFLLSDGQSLWWSKRWGILQFPALAPDSVGWTLIGVEGKDQGGLRVPTFRDFFVWEAGDVLQYRREVWSISQGIVTQVKLTLLSQVIDDSSGIGFEAVQAIRQEEIIGFSTTYSSASLDTTLIHLVDSAFHPTNLYTEQIVPYKSYGSLLQDIPYVGFVNVYLLPDGTWQKALGGGGMPMRGTLFLQRGDTLYTDYYGSYPMGPEVYETGKGLTRYRFGWGLGEIDEDSILVAYQTASDTFGRLTPDSILLSVLPLDATLVGLKAFPNPVRERLTLEWNPAQWGREVRVHILDMHGRLLLSQSIPFSLRSLSLAELPAGIYLLRVAGQGGGIRIHKL